MQKSKDGILFNIIVKPGSREVKIHYDLESESLIVNLKNPPTKGKANKELYRILKEFFEHLSYKSTHFTIVRGHTSQKKVIFIKNISLDEFRSNIQHYFEINV